MFYRNITYIVVRFGGSNNSYLCLYFEMCVNLPGILCISPAHFNHLLILFTLLKQFDMLYSSDLFHMSARRLMYTLYVVSAMAVPDHKTRTILL